MTHIGLPAPRGSAVLALRTSQTRAIELLALTWLGRGDYSKEEWREALEQAHGIHDEKEIEYLIGTPLLADYIEKASSQLRYSVDDLEIGRM